MLRWLKAFLASREPAHAASVKKARRDFQRAFLEPKAAKAGAKAHVRTAPTLSEAELQERVHDALRRGLSA
jgi:hypothetical protein